MTSAMVTTNSSYLHGLLGGGSFSCYCVPLNRSRNRHFSRLGGPRCALLPGLGCDSCSVALNRDTNRQVTSLEGPRCALLHGLRSGSFSFSHVPMNRHKNGELTRLRSLGYSDLLRTKRGSKQQKEGSFSAILKEIMQENKQGDVIVESNPLVVPKSPEALPAPQLGVKQVKKMERFKSVFNRVRKEPQLAAAVMYMAESLLTLLEPAKFPDKLVDNFAPVSEECPPTSGLEVTGQIPECLNGTYLRNGSNPQFMPSGGYHVFDGDGMIHAVRIKDGIPSYCCRFVHTYRYLLEKELGHPLFPNPLGELNGWPGFGRMALYYLRGALGILDTFKRFGTANAGLAFYDGKLLAISEDDMPYAIAISPDDGDLHNLGRYSICCSTAELGSMTAHPKIDPVTGEMFSYSYRLLEAPYVNYWTATAHGEMNSYTTVTGIKEPVLLHDFAVTERYAIVPDPTMVFRMEEMLVGRTPVVLDEKKTPRFGVLPKFNNGIDDDSAIKWFDVPGSSCVHYLNAWEEGDEVVLVGSSESNHQSRALTDLALFNMNLTEYRMNLKTGKCVVKKLSEWNLDMGRINDRFLGRKSRFAYLPMAGPWPKFSGIVKFDIDTASAAYGGSCLTCGFRGGEVAVRKFPEGCFGSEPCFVPRIWGASDADSEDDGYIVTFLHNEITNVSELGIFDARSPTLEPVAMVKLPKRVPYGFHGIFLTEQQLANQYSS